MFARFLVLLFDGHVPGFAHIHLRVLVVAEVLPGLPFPVGHRQTQLAHILGPGFVAIAQIFFFPIGPASDHGFHFYCRFFPAL